MATKGQILLLLVLAATLTASLVASMSPDKRQMEEECEKMFVERDDPTEQYDLAEQDDLAETDDSTDQGKVDKKKTRRFSVVCSDCCKAAGFKFSYTQYHIRNKVDLDHCRCTDYEFEATAIKS